MNPSSRFGISVERFARFGAPLTLWERALGDEFGAARPLLVSTNELAKVWMPTNPAHPRMRVIDFGDGRYRAVCDEDMSDPIDLTKPDLVYWRADEGRLRKMVCDTLGLSVSRDELRPLPGLLRIGEWRFSPSAGCPVWLACATTDTALAEQFRQAAAITSHPSIVLLPTRSAWGLEAERYAPRDRFLTATIDEAIAADGTGWSETDSWDELLGGFVEAAGIRVSGGFRAKKKKEKVAKAGGTAAKLKDEIREWYVGARRHLLDHGELLPAPSRDQLARACGVSGPTVSRWLSTKYSERDKELKHLWGGVNNPDRVRDFRS
ncbi:hypothetical protein [Adonisia turfae]